jgi:hypothetical protein
MSAEKIVLKVSLEKVDTSGTANASGVGVKNQGTRSTKLHHTGRKNYLVVRGCGTGGGIAVLLNHWVVLGEAEPAHDIPVGKVRTQLRSRDNETDTAVEAWRN